MIMFNKIIASLTMRSFVTITSSSGCTVKLQQGKFHSVLNPGLNLYIPYYQQIKIMPDKQLRIPVQMTRSRDDKFIIIDGSVHYTIIDGQLAMNHHLENIVPIYAGMVIKELIHNMDESNIMEDNISPVLYEIMKPFEHDLGIKIISIRAFQL